jgi:hypothetical protein
MTLSCRLHLAAMFHFSAQPQTCQNLCPRLSCNFPLHWHNMLITGRVHHSKYSKYSCRLSFEASADITHTHCDMTLHYSTRRSSKHNQPSVCSFYNMKGGFFGCRSRS